MRPSCLVHRGLVCVEMDKQGLTCMVTCVPPRYLRAEDMQRMT